ncbi:MAG: dTMP kinase [Deltaproteobacteria bacterium]|jgi:dTMP kinase|nr:dTMP kinase [Deltaproteobacteria bacterium]
MFIAFEGIEGAGKGTAAGRTAGWLASLGREVSLTREPGGSELGLALRALLLDMKNSGISPETELFLYLADRAQHVRQVIRPALEQGRVVLCDRFACSNLAYQGYGRGMDLDMLRRLNDWAVGGLWPDLTLVLDLEPAVGLERAKRRNRFLGLEQKEGRFEAEDLAFHTRVREGYRELSRERPDRVRLVDASGGEEDVFKRIKTLLLPMFSQGFTPCAPPGSQTTKELVDET